jgi:hypothetical protein
MDHGSRAALRRTPGRGAATRWLKAIMVRLFSTPRLGPAVILAGAPASFDLSCEAGSWSPEGRAVSRKSALLRPRTRLTCPSTEHGPGAARSQWPEEGAAAEFPGEGASCPRTVVALAMPLAAAALGCAAAVTAGGPAEARVCPAGAAGPVAWSATGSILASAATCFTLAAAAAARLAASRTTVWAGAAEAAFARAAFAAAGGALQVEDELLEGVEALREIRRLVPAHITAPAAPWHSERGRIRSALGRVVLPQTAGRRCKAQDNSRVGALLPAAAMPRRFAVALRRGAPADGRGAQRASGGRAEASGVPLRATARWWAARWQPRCGSSHPRPRVHAERPWKDAQRTSGRPRPHAAAPVPNHGPKKNTLAQLRTAPANQKRPLAGAWTLW